MPLVIPGPEDREAWVVVGRDPAMRRKALRFLLLQRPGAKNGEFESLFDVSADTIKRDLRWLRAEVAKKWTVAEAGESIGMVMEIAEANLNGAAEDVAMVPPTSPMRARHRSNLTDTLDKFASLMFRLGFWKQAAQDVNISQGDSLSIDHARQLMAEQREASRRALRDPEACRLQALLAARQAALQEEAGQ